MHQQRNALLAFAAWLQLFMGPGSAPQQELLDFIYQLTMISVTRVLLSIHM